VCRKPVAITKIRQADGTYLEGAELPKKLRPFAERRFEEGVTAKATEILKANVLSGTGTKAKTGCPVAGKTGTTDKHSDGWFVGFTPRLATAVWVGYPDSQVRMYSEYHGGPVAGGTFPAEIWGDYMKRVKDGYCKDFEKPEKAMTYASFDGKYAIGGSTPTTTTESPEYTAPYDPTVPDGTGTTTVPVVPAPVAPAPVAPVVPPVEDPAPVVPEPEPDTGTGNGGSGGSGGYDPSLYESPPQEPPDP